MKEYLYYFANQEVASGKLDFENIMKFYNDSEGNMYSVIDEKFFSDFLINYPFDLDFVPDKPFYFHLISFIFPSFIFV